MPEQEMDRSGGAVAIVALIVMGILALAAVGYGGWHWLRSVKANDIDRLARLAENWLEAEDLTVVRTEQKGDYLAALCQSGKGGWYLCEYERDRVWHNRWHAQGGKKGLRLGEIASWNYGSPQGEAVLIVCGCRLNDQAYWYTFRCDGVTYVCPVRDDPLLDIFVIPDSVDISAVPVLLGKDYLRLEG